ncbi:hypothetical protein SAMN05216258_108119 [Albimonas pacifica]|uniref:Uncharacterized protein n=1 Tax=Albimonas pacifica TaxID=1114924 RepID=A0A1I3JS20_9RHOB|nr:hypothetical protein SAMN05216258_108119 [Albimonas pacifica]
MNGKTALGGRMSAAPCIRTVPLFNARVRTPAHRNGGAR